MKVPMTALRRTRTIICKEFLHDLLSYLNGVRAPAGIVAGVLDTEAKEGREPKSFQSPEYSKFFRQFRACIFQFLVFRQIYQRNLASLICFCCVARPHTFKQDMENALILVRQPYPAGLL
jgi:hypothetical protein